MTATEPQVSEVVKPSLNGSQPTAYPSGRANIVHTDQLTRLYGPTRAVDEVNFDVREGEIFGFLGPNGAGKSTTIKMLTTLVRPTTGSATVVGYDLATQANQIRNVIGYVAQEIGVDNRASGWENLELQGHLYHLSNTEIKQRVTELLELVDLSKDAKKLAGAYSGGMRKRLDIATGLIHRPKLLFLDEPTTGLDPQTRANLWEYIRRLNQEQGVTIFLTTHYLEEADRLCDRVAIIDHGKIMALDTPNRLKDEVSGDVISISFDSPEMPADPAKREAAKAALTGQPWVTDIKESDKGGLNVYVSGGETAMPQMLRILDQHNLPVVSISMSRPSLDDVFLKYTGHQMRDEAGSERPTMAQMGMNWGARRGRPGGR